MSKVILFDLDGTLLPMNTEKFVEGYLKILSSKVVDYIDPEFFVKALWKGTHAMIANLDPTKTNEEVFKEEFLAFTELNEREIWPILDNFYTHTFPTLSYLSEHTPWAKRVVEEALERGFRVGIATNPVFPRQAIEHRINWAGIDHIPFEVVTVYEDSYFTKPHKEYYQMIANRLEVEPEECIMVGNDVQEDISSSQIGMKTYLVEGFVMNRGEPLYQPNETGSLEDLYRRINKREGIFA